MKSNFDGNNRKFPVDTFANIRKTNNVVIVVVGVCGRSGGEDGSDVLICYCIILLFLLRCKISV